MAAHWLFKTEPGTYSFQQLLKDGKTNWNGVRNFQARNFLREVAPGDQVLIYHSGDERQVVGLAQVTRGAFPDPDPRKKGDWVQLEIAATRSIPHPVTLQELKAHPDLAELLLIRQSRLSCMPITSREFKIILKLGKAS